VRLLLDTHVILWALADADRLSEPLREAIKDRHNDVLVSAASAWEIATKHRLGKLPQAEVIVRAYPEHVQRLGASELPVTSRHALEAGTMSWTHRDPFDRVLAAQASIEHLTLATVDRTFATLPGLRVLS